MTSAVTREIKYIRLPEQRIKEIEDLVSSWPFEIKAFMYARLNQFNPRTNSFHQGLQWILSLASPPKTKEFKNLKDPFILTDWQKRFRISGQTNPQESWNKILQDEISAKDYVYLKYLLKKDLTDVHVPGEIVDIFENVYRAHLRKEYLSDPAVPAAPLLMIIGPSGSGKTSTTRETVEKVIFGNEVKAEIDLKLKKDELLADKPFWKSISAVDEDLYLEMIRRKKLKFYKLLSNTPLVNKIFRKSITKNISSLEETGIRVDYQMITPNDYRTALAGEPGNYFKKAMGNPARTSIRHVEEAHSAFGRADSSEGGVESQQRTLIDTSNIIIDEIINGRRDCLLIATTDQPERCDSTIFRRFVEKGKVIDISRFWKEVDNLREVVRLELVKNDVKICDNDGTDDPGVFKHISRKELDLAVSKIYEIFDERSLKLTPSYVRKLIKSIVEIKKDFKPQFLEDSYLVRQAFELVAKNSYGDLFEKVVGRMDRKTLWETYVGSVKYAFSEMANNCLFYGVDEEKGVVLSGPPGSGKTFLVRSWLSENSGVHDIATSPGALRSSANPIDGAVENLEKVYDIAKMIAPTVVFFDEGDSLAPRRSASGGSPTDKLTNKFLNIIDGEVPLNRVFTVLTTNRLDILDPALIRSKRLKAMEITGVLKKQDISEMITFTLKGVPLAAEINEDAVMEAAQGICDSPADYAAFIEKARTLRKTEYEVLVRFRDINRTKDQQAETFIKLNFKTLKGILNVLEMPANLKAKVKKSPQDFMENLAGIEPYLNKIKEKEQYPLVMAHLNAARKEIAQSPVKKGKVQLDEFLEAELSQEPQVGFIIGVGASDTSGVLLPIATSLIYNYTFEKIMVTGAVSSSASAAAELDMAVQMMQQSAKEALTMVENYLQSLLPKFNVARIIGDFLNNYTIHHQLLSASYNVGGPSAGYALAVNTLSVLLNIPVYHDFGITGAPWTKGVRRGEVGSPVIIGGHKKKTEKVLLHLRRMYMPKRNYDELQPDYLAGYWSHEKDILAVTNFGDLVPEVIHFGKKSNAILMELIDKRITYKLKKNEGEVGTQKGLQTEIIKMKRDLSKIADKNIVARLQAIQRHVRNGQHDPDISMSELFHDKPEKRRRPESSLTSIMKRKQAKDFIPSTLAGKFLKRERG